MKFSQNTQIAFTAITSALNIFSYKNPKILSISQSSFDLCKHLEQQIDASQLIATTEIIQTKITYTVRLEQLSLGKAAINIKITDLTLVVIA